jgi:hypothetical protein
MAFEGEDVKLHSGRFRAERLLRSMERGRTTAAMLTLREIAGVRHRVFREPVQDRSVRRAEAIPGSRDSRRRNWGRISGPAPARVGAAQRQEVRYDGKQLRGVLRLGSDGCDQVAERVMQARRALLATRRRGRARAPKQCLCIAKLSCDSHPSHLTVGTVGEPTVLDSSTSQSTSFDCE